MSWQCPYCENVNQDAVPICTVCERVAPVVEAFLSLEQIDHAREYEDLISSVYSFEAESDYERMLETALKAASTFSQNDVAISKIHLAVELSNRKKIQDILLIKVKEYIELNQYIEAQPYVRLWLEFKLDRSLISYYSDIINEEIEKIEHEKIILKQVTEHILNGEFHDALTIIETELLTKEYSTELIELRTKVQNIIKTSENKGKKQNIPKVTKPPKKNPYKKDKPVPDEGETKPRKYPIVKRK